MIIKLSFGIVACGNRKKEALLQYMSEDRDLLIDLESAFLESYNSVTEDNYTNNRKTLAELTNNTIILALMLSA